MSPKESIKLSFKNPVGNLEINRYIVLNTNSIGVSVVNSAKEIIKLCLIISRLLYICVLVKRTFLFYPSPECSSGAKGEELPI
jgi:hypothetical protein